ncbi:MAG: Flp pilus assembly protein CpaB [Candidatus Methanoperedenaceae archaeon]|nr:Flp pilus assembly protein CpaB [Candidatus Methanoperedenaceae archaeon]
MGKWKAVIPIALGLLIALISSFVLYKWLNKQTAPHKVAEIGAGAIPVAVAAVDLPWGTKLESKPEIIKTIPFVEENLPAGYFPDPDSLARRILIISLKKNEPILESKLAPASVTMGGVSAVIKPGKRALAVKGDKVIGISGFIHPNNRVDVLVTMTDPKTDQNVTKTILENVIVLATGEKIEQNEKGEPSPVDVYTLEVTPEESEKLALGAVQGRLQFALRSTLDNETVLTTGATVEKTLASFSPAKIENKAQPKVKIKPKEPVFTVEIIKGLDRKEIKF